MVSLFNLLWLVFVGWWTALVFLILGALFSITVVGIPIGKSLFEFAKLSAFPFGKEVIREVERDGVSNVSDTRRIGGIIVNAIWLPIGLILTLGFFLLGLLAAITVVGIPIAIVYVRMGKFLLFPIGAKVVSKKQAYASAVANEFDRRGR